MIAFLISAGYALILGAAVVSATVAIVAGFEWVQRRGME